MAIYLKIEKEPSTIEELLDELFSYSGMTDRVTNVTTYIDKECTQLQCSENRFRSFDDVLECVQTYFPETTEKDLIHEIILFKKKGFEILPFVCCTIHRIVFLYYTSNYRDKPDLFNGDKEQSKWSWKELLAMLDITNHKELEEYITKHRKVEVYANS